MGDRTWSSGPTRSSDLWAGHHAPANSPPNHETGRPTACPRARRVDFGTRFVHVVATIRPAPIDCRYNVDKRAFPTPGDRHTCDAAASARRRSRQEPERDPRRGVHRHRGVRLGHDRSDRRDRRDRWRIRGLAKRSTMRPSVRIWLLAELRLQPTSDLDRRGLWGSVHRECASSTRPATRALCGRGDRVLFRSVEHESAAGRKAAHRGTRGLPQRQAGPVPGHVSNRRRRRSGLRGADWSSPRRLPTLVKTFG